ncbi:hypothetical protein K503DRAFT_657982, partial [Rhizopogon vinicolor AM-OR11-026]
LERALNLVADGEINVDEQNSARGGSKTCKTPLKLNKATGKESNSTMAFSELNWGTATRDYYLSIKKRGPQ